LNFLAGQGITKANGFLATLACKFIANYWKFLVYGKETTALAFDEKHEV